MPYIVTLVADRAATTLSPATIKRVRDAVRGDAAVALAEAEAVDIACARTPDMDAVRAAIEGERVDCFGMTNRGRRKGLLVADMDSTVVTTETLDEIAQFAGLKDRIAAITERSMAGEIDFADALRERVGLLRGLDLAALAATWAKTTLTPGAKTLVATMKAHNAATALVSGGFTYFTERVAALCGFDVQRANTLLDDGAALTGVVAEPILDRDAKLAVLQELAQARRLRLRSTLAVGDGANDLGMIAAAGMGVAYHAKPLVAAAARHRVEFADLRALLFAQGYRAADFKQA